MAKARSKRSTSLPAPGEWVVLLFTNARRQSALASAPSGTSTRLLGSLAANLGLSTHNSISLTSLPSANIWKKELQSQERTSEVICSIS